PGERPGAVHPPGEGDSDPLSTGRLHLRGTRCPARVFSLGTQEPHAHAVRFLRSGSRKRSRPSTQRILSALEEKQVKVVVINWNPDFTTWIARDLLDALLTRFPNETALPRYSVRWRD